MGLLLGDPVPRGSVVGRPRGRRTSAGWPAPFVVRPRSSDFDSRWPTDHRRARGVVRSPATTGGARAARHPAGGGAGRLGHCTAGRLGHCGTAALHYCGTAHSGSGPTARLHGCGTARLHAVGADLIAPGLMASPVVLHGCTAALLHGCTTAAGELRRTQQRVTRHERAGIAPHLEHLTKRPNWTRQP